MLGQPRVDIALTPPQEPRPGNMQARRHRRRIAPKVLFYCFWAAPKQRSQFVEVEKFQDMVPEKRFFSGHARAVDADTCRYVPVGNATGRLERSFIFQQHSHHESGQAKTTKSGLPKSTDAQRLIPERERFSCTLATLSIAAKACIFFRSLFSSSPA